MKIIGLTGGIGSGKTTVSRMFGELGIPVYIADIEAKKLTHSSKYLKEELIAVLGEEAYIGEAFNKKYVADLIFNNKKLLEKVNSIIHPKVAAHFSNWCKGQHAPYVIKEAAILFENGSYKNCDFTILITSPEQVRMARVLRRDTISKKDIKARMMNQWSDDEKVKLADFTIENIDLNVTKEEVKKTHLFLLKTQNQE